MKDEKVYGYIRVSTKDQNESRQRIAMLNYGIAENMIYLDKQSGKDFERPEYKRLVRRLRPGDTMVIKSIDRLGRNYREILEQWQYIVNKARAGIVVLDMPLLNTRHENDLTGTLIADIVLQLLSYVAQTEREFIRLRQAEGIAAARARGTRFGALPLAIPERFTEEYAQWKRGEITAREAGRRLGVSHNTFLRWAQEAEWRSRAHDARL